MESLDLNTMTAMGILEQAAASLRPPVRLTVADYAENHRYMPNLGGGRGERWRNNKTPYLKEPMEVLTSGLYQTMAIVGPGQSGKTVIAENYLLASVAQDPARMLWYMQSDDALEAYVKDRINPMIDDHDELISARGPRSIDDSLHYKRFRGMSVQFLTASMGNLINKNAPRIIADEIDAWTIKGNVKPLLDIRRQAYQDESMLVCISHPDRATGMVPERDWSEGIMAIYADSTRCVWYWQCPKCGGYSSPNPFAARVMSLEYPSDGTLDEIEAGAHLVCPNNQCKIKEPQRNAMNQTGIWIGDGEEISKTGRVTGQRVRRKTAGYWMTGLMSPFILGGIGALARAIAKAERERDAGGEDDALRQVTAKQLGIPYSPSRAVGSVSAQDLAARVEPDLKLGEVPDGVRFLTIGVDANLTWFEWMVRGWGQYGESWIIDRGKVLAEVGTSADDWDMLIDIFGKAWPLADGSGRTMKARAAGFDTGGAPGVAQQAYSAFTRWRRARLLTMYGTIAGREAWSLIPLKGGTTLQAPRLQITYPDTARKANKIAGRGEVPVGLFNPNIFKDDLGGQLMKAEPGNWYVHFPRALLSKEPPHTFFEQMVSEAREQNGRWKKLVASARNESLDLMVMTHVVAHLHGLARINWEKPPGWAAPWDTNTLVSSDGVPTASGKAVPAQRKGGKVVITVDETAKKPIGRRLA